MSKHIRARFTESTEQFDAIMVEMLDINSELLEALEGVVSATTNVLGIYGDMEEIYCPNEFKAARAAIAKARGEGDE